MLKKTPFLIIIVISIFCSTNAYCLTEYGEQVVQNICANRGASCYAKARNHLENKCRKNMDLISRANRESIQKLERSCSNYRETLKICVGSSASSIGSSAPSKEYAKARMAQLTMNGQKYASEDLQNQGFLNMMKNGLSNMLGLNYDELGSSYGFEDSIRQRMNSGSAELDETNPHYRKILEISRQNNIDLSNIRDRERLYRELEAYAKSIDQQGRYALDLLIKKLKGPPKTKLEKQFHTMTNSKAHKGVEILEDTKASEPVLRGLGYAFKRFNKAGGD